MKYNEIEVALDNGHGMNTPGKRSPNGLLREAAWTREVVKIISDKLSQHGIKSFIVTPELNDTSLSTRAARVNKRVEENKKKGISTILFSVHLNAAGNGTSWVNATGWECWTTKGNTKSDILAECAYDAASEILSGFNVKMRTDNTDGDRDKENNWTILYKSNCPCILTENMFMDNKGDYEFLMSPYGKDLIANVHVKTVLNWCNLNK